MKCYSKVPNLHFCQKTWLLKQITNNSRNITKSDPAIQTETTTYCYISPRNLYLATK